MCRNITYKTFRIVVSIARFIVQYWLSIKRSSIITDYTNLCDITITYDLILVPIFGVIQAEM